MVCQVVMSVILGAIWILTFRRWSATLAARVRFVISRLVLVFVLPLDFHGRFVWSSLCIYLLLFMVLSLLCSHWIVSVCYARPSVGLFSLFVSP